MLISSDRGHIGSFCNDESFMLPIDMDIVLGRYLLIFLKYTMRDTADVHFTFLYNGYVLCADSPTVIINPQMQDDVLKRRILSTDISLFVKPCMSISMFPTYHGDKVTSMRLSYTNDEFFNLDGPRGVRFNFIGRFDSLRGKCGPKELVQVKICNNRCKSNWPIHCGESIIKYGVYTTTSLYVTIGLSDENTGLLTYNHLMSALSFTIIYMYHKGK